MPKLNHVLKARKDNPVVKKGEPYYWWKFAFGAKQFSKNSPARSRLTQSEFFSNLWDLEDSFNGDNYDNVADLKDAFEEFSSALEEIRDEQEEKRENMPESLQESPTGELLTERYDALEDWINEIDSIETDFDPDDFDPGEDSESQFCENLVEEFTALFGNVG